MSNMDLHLGRFDLATVGANQRDTMKIMPSAKANKRQKVVIGDDTGIVHAYTVKKGETTSLWKSVPGRREVTALCIGGVRGAKDKVYVAYGQQIVGLNKKKGQSFFQYQTDLNEDIKYMFVEEMTIWTTCEYILNVFESSKMGEKVADTHFFMSPDKINHLCMSPISSPIYYNPILACHDKHIRVIKDSELLLQQKVGGPVMALTMYSSDINPIPTTGDDLDSDGNQRTYKQLLYGTDAGTFGQVLLDSQSIRQGWTAPNKEHRAGISAMAQIELMGTGVPDVVVGRDDGTIEVYSFDMSSEPQQQFMRELNESITSIDTGFMVGVTQHDIVVSTYSGKLLTYTSEIKSNIAHIAPKKPESGASFLSKMKAVGDKTSASTAPAGSSSSAAGMFNSNDATSITIASGVSTSSALIGTDGKSKPHEDGERTVTALRSELDVLRTKVEQAREKFSKISTEMIAVEQQFKIKSSFKLLPSEACYILTLEIQIPLDVVTLQSNVPIMLLDVDSNKAMVSRTVADQKNENELLATYRCQDSTNRIEIKVRTVEGQHGSLNAYIIPKLTPKTCQKYVLSIKPLSLHEKVTYDTIKPLLETRPLNTLTITGSFTLMEIHMWIHNSLPEVAPRATSDDSQLCFQSTFLHTILLCDYSKGKGVFKSDSITAISILKEVMTKDATNKKISINVKVDLNPDSVYSFLDLLRPSLDHHFSLSRRHDLIEPLKELATHEPATDYLSPEYKEILEKAEEIKAQVKVAPRHLDFLRGIVTDLFVDKHKLSGLSAESKIAGLLDVLKNYDYQKLVAQFKQI